jgi:Beta-lactamase enzyme family
MTSFSRREMCLGMAAGLAASAMPSWAASKPREVISPVWKTILALLSPDQRTLLRDPNREVQLIYTQIDRTGIGKVAVKHHTYQLAPKRWFFPASTIKLPMALLACEALAKAGGNLDSAILLNKPPETGNWEDDEPLSETLRRSLRRTFTVSDNVPYNRFYELLGPDRIHARLKALGYPNTRAIARLGSRDSNANRRTGSAQIIDADGRPLLGIAPRVGAARSFPFGRAMKGQGFLGDDGVLVPGPHNFSLSNFMPLLDLHHMLLAFVLPSAVAPSHRWNIPNEWRKDILEEMGRFPRESQDPVYAAPEFYDGYAKFFTLGDSKDNAPEGYRAYGKIGQAYGYLTDSSYIVDSKAGTECFLSAVIHCNPDGIYNDDKYDYDEVGLPFLAELGKVILAYEKARKGA